MGGELENPGVPAFPTVPFMDNGRMNRFSGAFPDPYLDYASTQMPRSIYDVLRWCEFVWITYGTYRMAAQRVVRYFLTSIELTDASDDEKKKYEDHIYNELDILNSVLGTSGDNFMAYGNDFISVIVPFRRYLRCKKCGLIQPIRQMSYRFEQWQFMGRCKKCNHDGVFERIDRQSIGQDKLRVHHWSPHEMRLLYHPIDDRVTYLWEIPGYFKSSIKKGDPFYLENTPWEVIEAIKDDKLFRFDDDVIFHLREDIITGVRCFGWGVPRVMGNFKQAWYIQVLKRYNEAIALDYIMPLRILTPQPGTSKEADPLLHMNVGNFHARVLAMFRQHRKDPTTIHTLPFPVNLELLGAEGKTLAPVELMDKATDEFLNAQGVAAELYRGTLQWQAMPGALRLFERTWVSLVNGFNAEINWLFRKISQLRNWENLKGRLQPTTTADDMEKKQIQLQLAAGQQISRQTAWSPFGINFREEIRRMLQEEEYAQEEMAKFQEQQTQKQQLQQTIVQGSAGAMPPGAPAGAAPQQPGQVAGPAGQTAPPAGAAPAGSPMGVPAPALPAGGMGGNVTPDDLMQQAEQIAYQMKSMPYEMRRSEMLKIKRSNETLHALVVSKMRQLDQTAKTQGGYAMMQQMVGAGAG